MIRRSIFAIHSEFLPEFARREVSGIGFDAVQIALRKFDTLGKLPKRGRESLPLAAVVVKLKS